MQKRDEEPIEKQDLNGCLAAFCYIGEFLLYPAIMALLHLIYFGIQGVILIVLGIFLAVLIPFFPIYLICFACGESGKVLGCLFLGLSLLSLVLIFAGVISIVLSPLIAVWQFFYVYYLIFSEGISPYFAFAWNWKQMTVLMLQSRELGVKYYNVHKKKFKIEQWRIFINFISLVE